MALAILQISWVFLVVQAASIPLIKYIFSDSNTILLDKSFVANQNEKEYSIYIYAFTGLAMVFIIAISVSDDYRSNRIRLLAKFESDPNLFADNFLLPHAIYDNCNNRVTVSNTLKNTLFRYSKRDSKQDPIDLDKIEVRNTVNQLCSMVLNLKSEYWNLVNTSDIQSILNQKSLFDRVCILSRTIRNPKLAELDMVTLNRLILETEKTVTLYKIPTNCLLKLNKKVN